VPVEIPRKRGIDLSPGNNFVGGPTKMSDGADRDTKEEDTVLSYMRESDEVARTAASLRGR